MTDPCAPAEPAEDGSFQARVLPWLIACFGAEIASDKIERNHRFLEEALETVQAAGCTRSEAHQLVDYVYSRSVGELAQEVGGVMNTLAALCLAHGLDMQVCAEVELARVWTKVEKIRAKQAAKPKNSPLPEHTASLDDAQALAEARLQILNNLREGYRDGERRIETLRAQVAALEAQNAAMRALVQAGLEAVNAAYAQAQAEYQGRERAADKHDKVVMEWRQKARAAVAQSSGGEDKP